jgi:fatty acid desaturase
MQLSHDGSHFAVSRYPRINALCTWTSLPYIYHPVFWYMQHVLQHHVFTNDKGDVDLIHLSPLGRLSPLARWKWFHRANALFAVTFLPLMTSFAESMHYPLRLLRAYMRGDLDRAKVLSGCTEKAAFMFGSLKKRLLFGLALGISLSLYLYVLVIHGVVAAATPWVVAGAYFCIISQVSHLQEECQDPELEVRHADSQRKVRPWSHRQILHTVDYNPHSSLVNILTGGLNTQSIHHLFPTIHNAHYIALWPRLAPIMAKHGVLVSQRSSIFAALVSWFHWMDKLGNPLATAAALH